MIVRHRSLACQQHNDHPSCSPSVPTLTGELLSFCSVALALADLECKSFVGLFPEIHRAFITIDNKLFLWNYYDGNDFYVYDELSQIIISVALLKPKPGVFVSSIQHILVLSTPVEILMFAVKFDADNVHNPLQLFPTQFTVPSDNVHMTAIVGTEQGRIFLCGRDGGIYELDYWSGEEGGWFSGGGNNSASSANGGAVTASSGLFSVPFSNFFLSNRKKCRKVNHTASSFKLVRSILPVFLGGTGAATASDHHVESIVYDSTRNFLYTLGSEPNGRSGATKPIISVYELGHDGWGMKLRSRNDNILDGARAALRQVSSDMYADLSGSGVDLNLVHLSPIPSNESASIILMAVTSHGHRLYFDLESRSDKLRVKIVRLCPPAINPEELHRGLATSTAASSAAGRAAKVEPRFAKGTSPSLVHSAYYKDGILLMADAGRSALGDSLVSIHKDPRPVAAGGAASAAASSSYGGRPWGVGSSSTTYVSALNETIDSFDFESRIADVGEVHQASSLNLLSSSLFARANASAFSSRYTVAAAPRLVQLPKPLAGLTELATQHITPNRQLLILTSSSLLTLAKIRPLDELKHALSVKKRTGDEGALMQIWHKYGAKEACAMCLTLVGANYMSAGGVDLDDVEKRSGQVVNGHAGNLLTIASPNKLLGVPNGSSAAASALSSTGVTDEQIRKAAKQAFFRFGELQQESAAANAYRHGAAATSSSAKLEGVALYLSRWLRSHWDWSLCVLQSASSSAAADSSLPVLAFRFSKDFYLELLQPLVKLQRFLEESQRLLVRTDAASLSSAAAAVPAAYGGAQSGLADPARMELENFNALSALLNLTIEVFNLLLLFLTYAPNSNGGGSMSPSAAASQLLRTSTFLVSSDLQLLKDMKFYDVVTTAEGHALVRKLINTIAYVGTAGGANAAANDFEATSTFGRFKRGRDAYASDDASNQLISQLHTACPTFFGSSDLLYYNALDSLKLAKQQWNMTSERASHIGRALQTYHSFLHASSFPLEDIADKLKGVYEYSGIVELAMRRAELMERREVAKPKSVALGGGARAVGATTILHANGQGAHLLDDEYYAYQRKRCFDVILDTMNILMFGVVAGKSISGNGASSEPRGLTSTTVTVDATIPPLSPSELSAVRDRVVAHILASVDPQLHQSLYLWYIEKGLLPDLYAIQSEHLIRFLTSSEEYVMILKDYYLRNERWHEAALLLNYLSLKRGAEYTLKERVDFLTGSIGCARNFQQQLQRHGASPAGRASKRGGGLAATQTSVAEQQDLIDQLKDRIEIAKIQADIYKKLKLVLDEVRRHSYAWRQHF